MNFKNFTTLLYIAFGIIILLVITLFPDLFSNQQFTLSDILDNGHSKYIEHILSYKTINFQPNDTLLITDELDRNQSILSMIGRVYFLK